jgi:hypothetical protein
MITWISHCQDYEIAVMMYDRLVIISHLLTQTEKQSMNFATSPALTGRYQLSFLLSVPADEAIVQDLFLSRLQCLLPISISASLYETKAKAILRIASPFQAGRIMRAMSAMLMNATEPINQ